MKKILITIAFILVAIITQGETLKELQSRLPNGELITEEGMYLYIVEGDVEDEVLRIYVYEETQTIIQRTISLFPISSFISFRRELQDNPSFIRLDRNTFYDKENDVILTLDLGDDYLYLIVNF